MLRQTPPAFAPAPLAEIDARLARIEREERVTIGLAIESGSRAWGFPSPDSDYDCRFLFVRRRDEYLSPWQQRDVIETPLVDEIDLNGWELGKALRLILKGNAVAIEWLMSPIVYAGDIWFRDCLRALATRHTDRESIARHYLHLGERQRRTYFANEKEVSLKKVFYALRPATALRWLRLHPHAAIAPMHFPTLLAGCDPPAHITRASAELIARKAETRELGIGALPAPIRNFIDDEFSIARDSFDDRSRPLSEEAKADADAFFRAAVGRYHHEVGADSTSLAAHNMALA